MAGGMPAGQEPGQDAGVAPELTELQVAEPVTLDDATPAPEAVEQPDAEAAPPAADERPRRGNRHASQMDDIIANRERVLEQERAEARAQGFADPSAAPPAPEPVAAAPEPRPAAEAPQGEQPLAQQAQPPVAPSPPQQQMIRVRVRDREVDLTPDQVIQAAAIGIDHAQQVEQYRRQAMAAPYQQPQIPSAGPTPPPAAVPAVMEPEPPGIDRDAAREAVREIMYGGDEEKAVDILSTLLSQRPAAAPVIDQDAIVRQVGSRIQAQQNLNNALHTFGQEYGDIINDAPATMLAANYVQQFREQAQANGYNPTELELFRAAGNAVRADVQRWTQQAQPAPQNGNGQLIPQTPAPPAVRVGDRSVLKRVLPQTPTAAAAVLTPPVQREETASDVVRQMRRARGYAVYP